MLHTGIGTFQINPDELLGKEFTSAILKVPKQS